jgi:Flp pilus assembly protein TadD
VSLKLGGPLLALVVVALASCGGSRTPAPPPAEAGRLRAQALVDSGNSAFRAGDFTSAAKRYAAAAVVSPDDPAAFYGLGMALSKLGRDDEARVAYARSRELSRGAVDRDSMPHEVRYRRTTHP